MDFSQHQPEPESQRPILQVKKWPFWRFGYSSESLTGELWKEFNTVTIQLPISDLDSFYKDVHAASFKAPDRTAFRDHLAQLRSQRAQEFKDALLTSSYNIVGGKTPLPDNHGEAARAHFQTLLDRRSLESAVRYLTTDHLTTSTPGSDSIPTCLSPQRLPSPPTSVDSQDHVQQASISSTIGKERRRKRKLGDDSDDEGMSIPQTGSEHDAEGSVKRTKRRRTLSTEEVPSDANHCISDDESSFLENFDKSQLFPHASGIQISSGEPEVVGGVLQIDAQLPRHDIHESPSNELKHDLSPAAGAGCDKAAAREVVRSPCVTDEQDQTQNKDGIEENEENEDSKDSRPQG